MLDELMKLKAKGHVKIEKVDADGNVLETIEKENLVVRNAYDIIVRALSGDTSEELCRVLRPRDKYLNNTDIYNEPYWPINSNGNLVEEFAGRKLILYRHTNQWSGKVWFDYNPSYTPNVTDPDLDWYIPQNEAAAGKRITSSRAKYVYFHFNQYSISPRYWYDYRSSLPNENTDTRRPWYRPSTSYSIYNVLADSKRENHYLVVGRYGVNFIGLGTGEYAYIDSTNATSSPILVIGAMNYQLNL